MVDIGPLVQEMDELYRRSEAQVAHRDQLVNSQRGWETVQTGLQGTAELLDAKAGEIAPQWQDEAGDLYGQRLRRSAASVQTWAQTLAQAQIGPALTTLAGQIDTTVDGVRQIKVTFDALVTQLAALSGAPATAATSAQVAQLVAQLQALVAQARQLIDQLDQAFAQAAQQVAAAPAGTAWDGPSGDGSGGAAAATTAAADGSAAAADASGAVADASGAAAATDAAGDTGGAVNAGGASGAATGTGGAAAVGGAARAGTGGGAPSLAGGAAPAPVVPPAGLPPIPPVAATPPPVVPGLAPLVPALGSAGVRTGGAGRGVAGAVVGATVAGGAARIPQAGRAAVAATPPTAATAPEAPAVSGGAASTTGSGTGRGVVPPMMVPPLAGGTGGAPKPGTPGDPRGRQQSRSPSAVPGVPPKLRGRAGTAPDARGFFAAAGQGSARRDRDAEPDANAPQLLDEELWQMPPAATPLAPDRRR